MKADRILVAVNALVAAGLGFGLAARGEPLPAAEPEWSQVATLRLAGIGLAGLGLAFGILGDPGTARERRRTAVLLAGSDLVLVALAVWQRLTLGTDWRSWLHAGLFSSLAVALVWLALEPRRGRPATWLFPANGGALFVLGTSAYIFAPELLPAVGSGHAGAFAANVGLLGGGYGTFGVSLLGLLSLSSWKARVRLSFGLAAGNAGCAAIVAGQQFAIWALPTTKGLVFLFVALAVAALWIGLVLLQGPQDAGRPPRSTLAPWLVGSHLAVAGAAGLGSLYLPKSTGIGLALGVAAAAGLAVAFLLHRQVAWAEAALVNLIEGEPVPRRPRGLTGPLAGLASAIRALTPNVQAAGDARKGWMRRLGEAAAQEERNRLARDLHDSIKQQLFSINVGAAAAEARWDGDPEGARAAVADVRQSAQAAMAEMKALLLQLRPEALAGAGLVEALREQCEALRYRTSAEVVCETGEPIPDSDMPPGAQEAIFRVAQEALSNVARHARARKVRLSLQREGETAVLDVEDDGQGFDLERVRPGMGLSNMRERASTVSGALEVDSSPGWPTRITLRVPFTKRADLTPLPLERSLRIERWLTAFSLLAGVPILLNLWGLAAIDPTYTLSGPFVLWWLLFLHQFLDTRRLGWSPKTFPAIRLRHAALRTQRTLTLAFTWWSLWYLGTSSWPDWSSREAWSSPNLFVLLFFVIGVIGFLTNLGDTLQITAWRRPFRSTERHGVLILILLGATNVAALPLSMLALTPALGIALCIALVAEAFLACREPRVPEPQP